MADEIKNSVDVYYGEQLIGNVSHGETGEIDCKGREMSEDIRIKVPYDMKAVKYQDKRFTVNKNGKHTLYSDEDYVMGAAIVEVEVPSDNEWLGEFDADTEYRVGSIVSQNDMVYICIVKPTNNQPPTNTTYWELLSGKIQDEKIVDIITHGKLEFLPDEGYIAVRKFTANVAETPTFDGTINIESGYTTISGSYVIDEQKAYDALVAFDGVKTYKVNFSAGGSASGMGDSIDFTSMTFDGDNGFIKYNDKAAFAMNGGFAEYTANYGDGNGARVNFEEGTECRKEFAELFLSIADEYVETTTITFTIDGTSYTAEDGMTFGDWIASSHNTGGFTQTSGSDTIKSTAGTLVAMGTSKVSISTLIESGYSYSLVSSTTSGPSLG